MKGKPLAAVVGSLQWMAVVPPGYALLALAVSVTIGLIFGIYPASRASRLDPVVAMRKD